MNFFFMELNNYIVNIIKLNFIRFINQNLKQKLIAVKLIAIIAVKKINNRHLNRISERFLINFDLEEFFFNLTCSAKSIVGLIMAYNIAEEILIDKFASCNVNKGVK